MNIGLTGGIATGKSTVSSMLTMKGALLVDADLIAREVMLPGHPVLGKVTEHFGQAILFEDGTLNRKLGEVIFHHPEQRTVLNEITHPAIRQEIRERTEAYERQYPDRLVVADIPRLRPRSIILILTRSLLFMYREALERLMVRDDLNREAAEARLNSQMDIEEKKRLADILIDNSGTLAETQRGGQPVGQVGSSMKWLRKKSRFCCLSLCSALYLSSNWMTLLYPIHYKDEIRKHAAYYEVDPFLVASIIRVETNFKPGKESKKGALGIMR